MAALPYQPWHVAIVSYVAGAGVLDVHIFNVIRVGSVACIFGKHQAGHRFLAKAIA